MSTDYYTPLFTPETDEPLTPLSVKSELKIAREVLAETAGHNIHNHNEMLRAAVKLDNRLRSLIAALDAERGGSE